LQLVEGQAVAQALAGFQPDAADGEEPVDLVRGEIVD
jgi:hypothetical protein